MSHRNLTRDTYTVTLATSRQQRHFAVTANADLFLTTLGTQRLQGRFLLHAFAIMPAYVHLLFTPSGGVSPWNAVHSIKDLYAEAAHAPSRGEVWHSSYFARSIRDLDDFDGEKHYMAQRPADSEPTQAAFLYTAHPAMLDATPARLLFGAIQETRFSSAPEASLRVSR